MVVTISLCGRVRLLHTQVTSHFYLLQDIDIHLAVTPLCNDS